MDTNRTDIAFNHSDCLRSQSNIGETVVHNICTGAQYTVPWGAIDWIGMLILLGVGLAFLAFLVALFCMAVRAWLDNF
jgi:hypothetical protein